MRTPQTVAELTELGRVRLSEHFFMREMLYSEVGNLHGIPNVPECPDLAIEVGRRVAGELLEPLKRTFGHVAIRSAYRSPTLNRFCHERHAELVAQGITDGAYYCSDNDYGAARHIWDLRDKDGHRGGTVSVVIPWYLKRYEASGDPRPLAWWVRDHIPGYAEMIFYPWLCAFNIRWYEGPSRKAIWIDRVTKEDELLTEAGMANFDGDHGAAYEGFPAAG